MKVLKPFYQVKIMPNESTGDFNSLEYTLEHELANACRTFLGVNESSILERTKQLAIAERIALSHYMTCLKIKKFANNACEQDNIKLNDDINKFLRSYNNTTKL